MRAARVAALAALLLAGLIVYVTQPLTGLATRAVHTPADPSRLRSHVEKLAREMVPRTVSSPANLERASRYIHDTFAASGAAVAFQSYETSRGQFRNVVARMGPDSAERLVVGAHDDAAAAGIGADDNASGVAGLLELTRIASVVALPIRVDFVAFSTEEPPYFGTDSMGSHVHARGLEKEGASNRAMICLEMIGFFTDAPASQSFPIRGLKLVYPSEGNFVTVVGCLGQAGLVRRVKRAMAESIALPVRSMNAPRFVPGIDFSDHSNYWDANFDAVMVTDTAFYRNANYHESSDAPETLDYQRMALVVDGVFAAIQDLGRDVD